MLSAEEQILGLKIKRRASGATVKETILFILILFILFFCHTTN